MFGNLTDSTVYNGNTILSSVHYEYNNAGKVTAMYEGLSAKYSYAENRVPPSSNYNLTTYTYDYWGNPATVTYANGGVDTTLYNAYGQLIHSYSRGSMHHEYTYDMYGRNVDDTYADGAYRTFYDSLDRVTSIGKLNGTTYDSEVAYTYDTLGRVTSETTNVDNKAVVKTFTYDEFGNKTNDVITLNGEQIYNKVSTYDEFLRLKSVAQGGKTTAYTYDDNGNLATETTGNVVTTYGYNDANMVLTMGTKVDNANVTNFVYNYYTDGNQRTKVDTINNVTTAYTYDGAGQLKSEVKTGSVTQTDLYWYDASGNRTLKNEYLTDEDSNTTSKFIRSTYNEMNQLVESIDSDTGETTTYTYDEYGNLINDGKYEYTYESYYNRLASTRNLETLAYTSCDYYVDGLRSSKRGSWYIWLNGNMVYEFTSSDSDTYTYGHRLLYSDDVKYVLNAHGDVVALLNANGVVTKRYEYDAFGNELGIDNTDTNPFRYCGEYFDFETGTIYLRARYYSPVTGRFTQVDPIRDGLNWYAYCGNNPILFIDASGLEKIVVSGGVYSASDGYRYNFIETGLTNIYDYYNTNSHNDEITWMIANEGWTDEEKNNFASSVSGMNVNIVYFDNSDQFTNYINYKTTSDVSVEDITSMHQSRINDPITDFSVFSHGATGILMFGYDYSDNYNKSLNFYSSDISKIYTSSFSAPICYFYSCYSGTGYESSFAELWQNHVGGVVWAYQGESDYRYISVRRNKGVGYIFDRVNTKINRSSYGFNPKGASWYPVPAPNGKVVTY